MNGNKHKKKINFLKILLPILGSVCVLGILSLHLNKEETVEHTNPMLQEIEVNKEVTTIEETESAQVEEIKETLINLGNGMFITEVGKYAGIYMEDGSDEMVSDIMMVVVKNEGEETIQYAEIKMPVGEQEAFFKLTTLTPGSMMVLLEQNRMQYVADDYNVAVAENVAIFQEPLSLCEDRLKIQLLDGLLNVLNISDEDIDGEIVIYYKYSAPDVLYGGITYRVRIEGGLKKDEIKQVTASHLSANGSVVMFVTCGDKT